MVRTSGITDVGLKELGGLPNLSTLDLRGASLSGAGVAHLKNCRLGDLDLSDTLVTDAELVHLASLRGLSSLNLRSTRIAERLLGTSSNGCLENGRRCRQRDSG